MWVLGPCEDSLAVKNAQKQLCFSSWSDWLMVKSPLSPQRREEGGIASDYLEDDP